jgi:hypothetical protein
MQEEAVVIARFGFRHEAEIAAGFLLDAGINSLLSADDAGGAGIGFSQYKSVRLLVLREDAERAREVLQAAGEVDF